MHYGFKMGYNKVDSNQNRNFLVPEVDYFLNRGLSFYVDNIFFPRNIKLTGFENTQRNIDNIRPLVVSQNLSVTEEKTVPLPENYWHFITGWGDSKKGTCSKKLKLFPKQTEDLTEESEIYKSDFHWGTLNFSFNSKGLQLYYDNDISVESISLVYVKKHLYIHNARDFEDGEYLNFEGQILKNHQNCELPDDSCRDIVDLAVYLAASSIQDPGLSVYKDKLTINQTI